MPSFNFLSLPFNFTFNVIWLKADSNSFIITNDHKILIYRLKEKQYFEYQKIIDDGFGFFGFKRRYESRIEGCSRHRMTIQYEIKYKIDNLKKNFRK